ncbi:MAG: hypothetical protein AABY06_00455, partial [Nanoarchaeota archaeon]
MKYDVEISKEAKEFLYFLDKKSRQICKKNLNKLEDNRHPGRGSGDKAKTGNFSSNSSQRDDPAGPSGSQIKE